jgi:hypothetical protein
VTAPELSFRSAAEPADGDRLADRGVERAQADSVGRVQPAGLGDGGRQRRRLAEQLAGEAGHAGAPVLVVRGRWMRRYHLRRVSRCVE